MLKSGFIFGIQIRRGSDMKTQLDSDGAGYDLEYQIPRNSIFQRLLKYGSFMTNYS